MFTTLSLALLLALQLSLGMGEQSSKSDHMRLAQTSSICYIGKNHQTDVERQTVRAISSCEDIFLHAVTPYSIRAEY